MHALTETSLPEGLIGLYDRITETICRGLLVEKHLAKRALSWVNSSLTTVTVDELQEALQARDVSATDDSGQSGFSNIVQTLTLTCCGLIEPMTMFSARHKSSVTIIQFIHLSVRTYFMDTEAADDIFQADVSKGRLLLSTNFVEAQVEITHSSLQWLTQLMPTQPLGGKLGVNISATHLYRNHPFYAYATILCTQHLDFALSRIGEHDTEIESRPLLGRTLTILIQFVNSTLL